MQILVNLVLATVCWLGLFEVHLIEPLAAVPVSRILESLVLADCLLWMACYAVVTIGMHFFDRVNGPATYTVDSRDLLRRARGE